MAADIRLGTCRKRRKKKKNQRPREVEPLRSTSVCLPLCSYFRFDWPQEATTKNVLFSIYKCLARSNARDASSDGRTRSRGSSAGRIWNGRSDAPLHHRNRRFLHLHHHEGAPSPQHLDLLQ